MINSPHFIYTLSLFLLSLTILMHRWSVVYCKRPITKSFLWLWLWYTVIRSLHDSTRVTQQRCLCTWMYLLEKKTIVMFVLVVISSPAGLYTDIRVWSWFSHNLCNKHHYSLLIGSRITVCGVLKLGIPMTLSDLQVIYFLSNSKYSLSRSTIISPRHRHRFFSQIYEFIDIKL